MIIETKIDFKKYIKLMYILTYRGKLMIYTSILGFLLLIISIFYFFGIIEMTKFPWIPIFTVIMINIVIPISVYYTSRKVYYTNARLQEKIVYEITQDLIIITGESFNSQMTWDKTYKVLELKEWFLFYHNKFTANIISKERIGNQTQELREIIKSQNIKYKLRNN